MAITFSIPGPLRSFAGGRREVQIVSDLATLSEALDALWIECPGLRDRIMTEQGQVREHINIFVGSEHVRYMGGLNAPISSGAEISILPAVSGGRAIGRGSFPGEMSILHLLERR